uniref:Uncharacterized protein n=1 Tax=Arion vulgaris TaxID=1028688 RepID=A0A0B7AE60_9EUPU
MIFISFSYIIYINTHTPTRCVRDVLDELSVTVIDNRHLTRVRRHLELLSLKLKFRQLNDDDGYDDNNDD